MQVLGDYNSRKLSSSKRKVGIRNKWGTINNLKARDLIGANGGNSTNSKLNVNPQIKQTLEKKTDRRGKVYNPGEVPRGQNLISRYLKSSTSRPAILDPEEK